MKQEVNNYISLGSLPMDCHDDQNEDVVVVVEEIRRSSLSSSSSRSSSPKNNNNDMIINKTESLLTSLSSCSSLPCKEDHKTSTSGCRGVVGCEANNNSEMNGRERLKRHRVDMAGRVWIPDIWGQEDFLKDWIDCSAFDACLGPNGLMSARASLIEEGRRATSNGLLRIENRC